MKEQYLQDVFVVKRKRNWNNLISKCYMEFYLVVPIYTSGKLEIAVYVMYVTKIK